ncbi:MAG: phosphatidate cytidylyltransferase [Promethearchaeota archaeon]
MPLSELARNLLSDLLLVAVSFAYIFATILIPKSLKKAGRISKFAARKAVHLTAGLSIFVCPYFNFPAFAILVAGVLTAFTYFSGKKSKIKALRELYETIGEEQEEAVGYLQGPFHYCLAITLIVTAFVFFAPTRFYFPIAGVLVMIVSDTLAAIVGKKFGKHSVELKWTNTTRSLEGSLTFLGSAWLLCLASYSFFGVAAPGHSLPLTWPQVYLLATLTAGVATVVEFFTPSTWDDLSIPIVTTGLMVLFAVALGAW